MDLFNGYLIIQALWIVSFSENIHSLEKGSVIGKGCNYRLKGPSETIFSPGYPRFYPNNARCSWTIEAPAGSYILLSIDDFEVESSKDCNFDYVQIYEGSLSSSTSIKLLRKLCGGDVPQKIRSSSNAMTILLRSDSNQVEKGFKMHYQTLEACEKTFTEASGQITPPGYPIKYAASSYCKYTILRGEKRSIRIKFAEFDIEDLLYNECSDYVSIYTGQSRESMKLIGTYCGLNEPPAELCFQDENVMIDFISDEGIGKKGFKINYVIADMSCFEDLGGFEMVVGPKKGLLLHEESSGDDEIVIMSQPPPITSQNQQITKSRNKDALINTETLHKEDMGNIVLSNQKAISTRVSSTRTLATVRSPVHTTQVPSLRLRDKITSNYETYSWPTTIPPESHKVPHKQRPLMKRSKKTFARPTTVSPAFIKYSTSDLLNLRSSNKSARSVTNATHAKAETTTNPSSTKTRESSLMRKTTTRAPITFDIQRNLETKPAVTLRKQLLMASSSSIDSSGENKSESSFVRKTTTRAPTTLDVQENLETNPLVTLRKRLLIAPSSSIDSSRTKLGELPLIRKATTKSSATLDIQENLETKLAPTVREELLMTSSGFSDSSLELRVKDSNYNLSALTTTNVDVSDQSSMLVSQTNLRTPPVTPLASARSVHDTEAPETTLPATLSKLEETQSTLKNNTKATDVPESSPSQSNWSTTPAILSTKGRSLTDMEAVSNFLVSESSLSVESKPRRVETKHLTFTLPKIVKSAKHEIHPTERQRLLMTTQATLASKASTLDFLPTIAEPESVRNKSSSADDLPTDPTEKELPSAWDVQMVEGSVFTPLSVTYSLHTRGSESQFTPTPLSVLKTASVSSPLADSTASELPSDTTDTDLSETKIPRKAETDASKSKDTTYVASDILVTTSLTKLTTSKTYGAQSPVAVSSNSAAFSEVAPESVAENSTLEQTPTAKFLNATNVLVPTESQSTETITESTIFIDSGLLVNDRHSGVTAVDTQLMERYSQVTNSSRSTSALAYPSRKHTKVAEMDEMNAFSVNKNNEDRDLPIISSTGTSVTFDSTALRTLDKVSMIKVLLTTNSLPTTSLVQHELSTEFLGAMTASNIKATPVLVSEKLVMNSTVLPLIDTNTLRIDASVHYSSKTSVSHTKLPEALFPTSTIQQPTTKFLADVIGAKAKVTSMYNLELLPSTTSAANCTIPPKTYTSAKNVMVKSSLVSDMMTPSSFAGVRAVQSPHVDLHKTASISSSSLSDRITPTFSTMLTMDVNQYQATKHTNEHLHTRLLLQYRAGTISSSLLDSIPSSSQVSSSASRESFRSMVRPINANNTFRFGSTLRIDGKVTNLPIKASPTMPSAKLRTSFKELAKKIIRMKQSREISMQSDPPNNDQKHRTQTTPSVTLSFLNNVRSTKSYTIDKNNRLQTSISSKHYPPKRKKLFRKESCDRYVSLQLVDGTIPLAAMTLKEGTVLESALNSEILSVWDVIWPFKGILGKFGIMHHGTVLQTRMSSWLQYKLKSKKIVLLELSHDELKDSNIVLLQQQSFPHSRTVRRFLERLPAAVTLHLKFCP